MKIINRIFNLLTIFLSIICLCVITLICFILIYPQINSNSPSKAAVPDQLEENIPFTDSVNFDTESSFTDSSIAQAPITEALINESSADQAPITESLINESSADQAPITESLINESSADQAPVTDEISESPAYNNNHLEITQNTQYVSQTSEQNMDADLSPSDETNNTVMVWIDDTAERYHKKDGCNMDNAYQVTLEEALSKGKTPCGNCYR